MTAIYYRNIMRESVKETYSTKKESFVQIHYCIYCGIKRKQLWKYFLDIYQISRTTLTMA